VHRLHRAVVPGSLCASCARYAASMYCLAQGQLSLLLLPRTCSRGPLQPPVCRAPSLVAPVAAVTPYNGACAHALLCVLLYKDIRKNTAQEKQLPTSIKEALCFHRERWHSRGVRNKVLGWQKASGCIQCMYLSVRHACINNPRSRQLLISLQVFQSFKTLVDFAKVVGSLCVSKPATLFAHEHTFHKRTVGKETIFLFGRRTLAVLKPASCSCSTVSGTALNATALALFSCIQVRYAYVYAWCMDVTTTVLTCRVYRPWSRYSSPPSLCHSC
jgi:hypothetical protein